MRKQELHPRTATINHKQKIQSKTARNEALHWLAEKFPAAFDSSTRIRPLKKGIMDDILAFAEDAQKLGISKSKLREAVVLFTRRIDYLITLKAREARVDLNGQATETVSEEEAEKAIIKIKSRIEKSAKNARKAVPQKPKNKIHSLESHNAETIKTYQTTQAFTTYYNNAENEVQFSKEQKPYNTTPSSVMIKRKSSRNYDPEAVARLKEKLGITHKKQPTE